MIFASKLSNNVAIGRMPAKGIDVKSRTRACLRAFWRRSSQAVAVRDDHPQAKVRIRHISFCAFASLAAGGESFAA